MPIIKIANRTDKRYSELIYQDVHECPRCKTSIVADCQYAIAYTVDDKDFALLLNYCSKCRSYFISTIEISIGSYTDQCVQSKFISSEPQGYKRIEFDKELEKLSPAFVEIYNQANQAECLNLDQIAGVGYRKSIEFLVKDYAKKQNPDDTDKIERTNLGICIDTYIDDNRIKTLAKKAVWLGNDETHYIRKHTDRDITDMKNFIKALSYFIAMVLITEDAETIEPK